MVTQRGHIPDDAKACGSADPSPQPTAPADPFRQAGYCTRESVRQPIFADPVRLGGHAVGRGRRAVVIAEAGVNHNGDLDTALAMVASAAQAGADFVKFQAFRAGALVSRHAPPADYQKRATGAETQQCLLASLELDRNAFVALRRQCDAMGIGFLATPFSPDDLDMLVGLGVDAVKMASTDLDNWPLLDACAATRLPLILSTGAAMAEELDATVQRLGHVHHVAQLVLLHCVSAYPATRARMNLRRIATLADRYGALTGFSDHTTATDAGGLAVAAGACVLEKHFTLDRTRPGPDQAASLEPDELAAYIRGVRDVELCLGDGELSMQACETDVRRAARKSVVAGCDIQPGETIRADMLAIKRAGEGISPRHLGEIVGAVATRTIRADQPIECNMLRR